MIVIMCSIVMMQSCNITLLITFILDTICGPEQIEQVYEAQHSVFVAGVTLLCRMIDVQGYLMAPPLPCYGNEKPIYAPAILTSHRVAHKI